MSPGSHGGPFYSQFVRYFPVYVEEGDVEDPVDRTSGLEC